MCFKLIVKVRIIKFLNFTKLVLNWQFGKVIFKPFSKSASLWILGIKMKKRRIEKFISVLNKRQTELTVLMENVHKPHNLAAIARTCDSVGIGEIHAIAGNEKVQLSQKTSGGTQKFVKLNLYETTKEGMETLKKKGFKIYVTHISEKAISYQKVDFTKPSAIVVGAELGGISQEILDFADQDIINVSSIKNN